jgi:hypothetical protein
MNMAEWLACTHPRAMWDHVGPLATNRKCRLFVCGCLRHVWQLLEDPRSRRAVEAAERYADEDLSRTSLRAAFSAAEKAMQGNRGPMSRQIAAALAYQVTWPHFPPAGVLWTYYRGVNIDSSGKERPVHGGLAHHRKTWVALLRDVFGNPFQRPAIDSPDVMPWQSGTVTSLAQAIYDDRAFDRLPILADALEDAGCTNPDILAHCRGGGEHVLGCWVVDLLLAKE